MAATDFAAGFSQQKLIWSRLTWKAGRDKTILGPVMGEGPNNPIHRVSELTETEKGTECIFHLVNDLVEDGGTADDAREGREEALSSSEQTIRVDLMNHGIKEKGKLANQKSVIIARELGRDKLSHWLADRTDQCLILSASGIGYEYTTDGRTRPANSKLKNLAFASDVRAPSAKRLLTWNGSTLLGNGDTGFGTGFIAPSYVPNYKMIVDTNAYMRTHHIKPLTSGGKEYFLWLVHPMTYAMLKMDPKFQAALIHGGVRGDSNPWFTGADVTVDGAVIRQHNKVFNTMGAAAASKWGVGGLVNGTRSLAMGAQAMAYADINVGDWVEKKFEYDSQWGINIDKMQGFLCPRFYSIYDQGVEDFGRVCVDHYLG